VKRERSRVLRDLDCRSGQAVRRRFLGQTRPVLWEGQGQPLAGDEGLVWSGLTDNYLRVLTVAPAGRELRNEFTLARLLRLEGDALWTQIVGAT
jgi:hypothetical protein